VGGRAYSLTRFTGKAAWRCQHGTTASSREGLLARDGHQTSCPPNRNHEQSCQAKWQCHWKKDIPKNIKGLNASVLENFKLYYVPKVKICKNNSEPCLV